MKELYLLRGLPGIEWYIHYKNIINVWKNHCIKGIAQLVIIQ
jgi:hypothetical protein